MQLELTHILKEGVASSLQPFDDVKGTTPKIITKGSLVMMKIPKEFG